MSTAELIVNVVLAVAVFAAVVGSLAWSITQGHGNGVERLRTRVARAEVSSAAERVGGDYTVDQGLAVGS